MIYLKNSEVEAEFHFWSDVNSFCSKDIEQQNISQPSGILLDSLREGGSEICTTAELRINWNIQDGKTETVICQKAKPM